MYVKHTPINEKFVNVKAHLRKESHELIESEELNLRVNSHNILGVSWNSKAHYHMPGQMNAVYFVRYVAAHDDAREGK